MILRLEGCFFTALDLKLKLPSLGHLRFFESSAYFTVSMCLIAKVSLYNRLRNCFC